MKRDQMKNFLLRLLVFLVGLLLLNALIAAVVIWPTYYGPYLESFGARHSYDYETILLADSHGRSLGQDLLSDHRILNLAEGSDNYADMYLKMEALLREGHRFKTLLLTVDDHTLSTYRKEAENNKRAVLFSTLRPVQLITDWTAFEYFKLKYVDPYLPMFSPLHAEFTRKWISQNLRELLAGPPKEEAKWSLLSERKRLEAARHRYETQFGEEYSEELEGALRSILNLADRNDIRVSGIRYPLAPTYLEVIGEATFGAHTLLSQAGYPVLDFKHRFENDPSMFRNQDHVNDAGAAIIVEELAKRLGKFRRYAEMGYTETK